MSTLANLPMLMLTRLGLTLSGPPPTGEAQGAGRRIENLRCRIPASLSAVIVEPHGIGNSLSSVLRNASGSGMFRVGERCFSSRPFILAAAKP